MRFSAGSAGSFGYVFVCHDVVRIWFFLLDWYWVLIVLMIGPTFCRCSIVCSRFQSLSLGTTKIHLALIFALKLYHANSTHNLLVRCRSIWRSDARTSNPSDGRRRLGQICFKHSYCGQFWNDGKIALLNTTIDLEKFFLRRGTITRNFALHSWIPSSPHHNSLPYHIVYSFFWSKVTSY